MSLFAATLLPGLILLLLGLPLLLDHSGAKAAIRAFPRSATAGYIVFSAAAAWFLYNIWHLSNADFGEYRTLLFIALRRGRGPRLQVRAGLPRRAGRLRPRADRRRAVPRRGLHAVRPAAAPLHGLVRLRRHRARDLARRAAVAAARLPRLALRAVPALARPRGTPGRLRHASSAGSRSPFDDARGSARRTPVLLVLAGPAGSGKSTLCDRLVDANLGFTRVVTSTTRSPRKGEEQRRPLPFLHARRSSTPRSPPANSWNGPGSTATAATGPSPRASSGRSSSGGSSS